MQADADGIKPCCDKMAGGNSGKNGCCGSGACNDKCQASGGGLTMNALSVKPYASVTGVREKRLLPADDLLVFAPLNAQERPPKSLA